MASSKREYDKQHENAWTVTFGGGQCIVTYCVKTSETTILKVASGARGLVVSYPTDGLYTESAKEPKIGMPCKIISGGCVSVPIRSKAVRHCPHLQIVIILFYKNTSTLSGVLHQKSNREF